MKFFVMLSLSVLLFSCQEKENKKPYVQSSDSVYAKKKKKEDNKQIGDTIYLDSFNEKGLYKAEGSLDSIHPRVYVKFKNEDLGDLKARIIPTTGKGNIRFNQIIFPDKSSDGPFGMDLKMQLRQKGNHVLVIGHSLMADNPYYGKFEVLIDPKME